MDRFSIAIIQENCPQDDTYCQINLWVWRIIPRIMLGVGTFGNVTNIAVISRKAMRSKPVIVLAFLAAFDLVCLWLSGITAYQWNMFEPGTTEAEVFNKVMSYLLIVGYFSSNWTIAIFTIERMACIFFPISGKLFCTTRKTGLTVVVLVVSQFIHAGIVMLGYKHFVPLENDSQIDNDTAAACPFVAEEFVESCDIFRVVILGTSTVLPLLVAITGNIALVIKFLCCKTPILLNSRPDNQTKMLFAITGFLAATMIATAFGLGLKVQYLNGMEVTPTLRLLTITLHVIHLSNYGVNFFLYLWIWKLFKSEFKSMCDEIKNKLLRRN